MKPFNLQEALAGKPVVTRDGQRVTQITYFKDVSDRALYGVLRGNVKSWSAPDGRFHSFQQDAYDLFMASEKKSGWIVLWRIEERNYPSCSSVIVTGPQPGEPPYVTGDKTSTHSGNTKVFLVKHLIEWEE